MLPAATLEKNHNILLPLGYFLICACLMMVSRLRVLDNLDLDINHKKCIKFFFFNMYGCLGSMMSVHNMHSVPTEARTAHQVPWDWSYR